MRYGDWEIYRIRSPWEILQLYLQESDYCSVSAGSQHRILIFICPQSAASIALTDSGGGGGLNKQNALFFRQAYAVVTTVHCAQSVWPLHFLSETKITFLGIIFVQTLQNIASILNREIWIICTLPELYRFLFKTEACALFCGDL